MRKARSSASSLPGDLCPPCAPRGAWPHVLMPPCPCLPQLINPPVLSCTPSMAPSSSSPPCPVPVSALPWAPSISGSLAPSHPPRRPLISPSPSAASRIASQAVAASGIALPPPHGSGWGAGFQGNVGEAERCSPGPSFRLLPPPWGDLPLAPAQKAPSRSALAGSNLHQPHSSPALAGEEATRGIAVEKFDVVKKWGINTYKCTKQLLSERFGRGSRTVDLELETQIELLRDTKRKYESVLGLARALTNHFYSLVQTQHALADAFSDLSQKSPELQEEFGYNAETQKLLCKNGETLLGAVNFFVSSINTLVNKTMEDTLMTVKQYETARLEYDAYRTDLEELNLGPRDASTLCRLDAAQAHFQAHRAKYEKLRADVAVKLKFLEENKVKVMHKQLLLFHNAISAYFAGNQQQLEQTLKQFNIKLKSPGAEKPSWLEEP